MLPAHPELTNIKTLFDEIDVFQEQVLLKISQICERHSDDEPVGVFREAAVKAATTAIQRISDLLRVVELKILQLLGNSAFENYLPETLDLYYGKEKHLRRKLKEAQLTAYREENAIIHLQRLREFCPAKSGEGGEETESVDARKALFKDRSTIKEGQHENNKINSIGDQILSQNKNITSSLQLSKQLMTMLVMQTELNIDTLDQQSKDLKQLNEKLINMETVLIKSREIVRFIERQDKQDKRRIYAAILFLLLCSAWVLWRRVLKMPVKIVIWSLLKMFGVVNWATSVTTRELRVPSETMSAISETVDTWSEASTLFTEAPSNIDTILETPQLLSAEWGVPKLEISLLFTADSTRKETKPLSTGVPSEEIQTSNIDEKASAFTEIYVPEIRNEESILTWDGTLPESTQSVEMEDLIYLISEDAQLLVSATKAEQDWLEKEKDVDTIESFFEKTHEGHSFSLDQSNFSLSEETSGQIHHGKDENIGVKLQGKEQVVQTEEILVSKILSSDDFSNRIREDCSLIETSRDRGTPKNKETDVTFSSPLRLSCELIAGSVIGTEKNIEHELKNDLSTHDSAESEKTSANEKPAKQDTEKKTTFLAAKMTQTYDQGTQSAFENKLSFSSETKASEPLLADFNNIVSLIEEPSSQDTGNEHDEL